MSRRGWIYGAIGGVVSGIALVAGVNLWPRVDAQSPFGRDSALVDIAPGTAMLSSSVTTDADLNTSIFKYDNLGLAFAAADALPIPDGATCSVLAEAGGGCCTCAWLADTAHAIGAQAALGTKRQVNGADQGSTNNLCGGQTVTVKANHRARQLNASWYSGVCDLASDHDEAHDVAVYLTCSDTADCANVAGTAGGAVCVADAASILNRAPAGGDKRAPADFFGCRCTTATNLNIWCER